MSNNLTLKTLASQQINDSAISGVTVKDALETLESLNAGSSIVLRFTGTITALTTGESIYLNGDPNAFLPFEDNLFYSGNSKMISKSTLTPSNYQMVYEISGGAFFTYWNNPISWLQSNVFYFESGYPSFTVLAYTDYNSQTLIEFQSIEIEHNKWKFQVLSNNTTENALVEVFIFIDKILNPATGEVSTPATGAIINGGDKNYIHNQIAPNNVWTITHNLGKFPSVTISDSTERIVIGDIHFINNNEIQIFFKGAFSGKAYIN